MPDKEQGLCLVGVNTRQFMVGHFDTLSPKERNILRNSRFNICTLCFKNLLSSFGDPKVTLQHMEEAIETGNHNKLRSDALSAYREHLRSNFEQL